jgi:acetyl-CoA carboxylase biotin carboxyl carrier protein
MSNTLDSMSDDEVRRLALLIETMDRSALDYLQVDIGNLKVIIGKGNPPQALPPGAIAASPAPGVPAGSPQGLPPVPPANIPAAIQTAVTPTPAEFVTKEAPAQEGTVTVLAPFMGRFYAKPEPGVAPFVSVGDEVVGDTTVGLIEVMKVFTAVSAGVTGVVTEICVQDAEFIEYGQVLIRVRPSATGSTGANGSRKEART